MKKNIWIWAIAALSMAACTSEDAPTPEQIVTENDWISPDGRIVVQLGAESTPAAVISRAPIEGDEITALEELGIFAINREETIKTEEWGEWPGTINNVLLKNVKAQGKKGTDGSPVDPLDSEVNFGKRLSLYNTEATTAGAVYYYPIQGTQKYNFYGYQPYQNGDNVTLASSGKPQIVFTLDGDMDLITGEAGTAPTVNENTLYVTEATETTAATLGDVNPIDGYNAKYIRKIKYHNWIIDESQKLTSNKLETSAKKAFIPNIKFGHRLTKLNFQVITAKEQAGGGNQSETTSGDREDATKLRVNTIQLQNVNKTVTLTVQDEMPLAYSNPETLDMIKDNTDDTNVWTTDNKIIPQEYNDNANYEYTSAGYLMVPATDVIENYASYPYRISLNVETFDSTGIPQTQAITLDLKDHTFEAGKSYNIRIALYALQEVSVSAELTDWVKGEDKYIPVE